VKPLPRSARKKPRVLFYSHDGLGLGHFRRTLAVAESLALQEPRASRLLLTGLPFAGAFEFPETLDYVRMPGLDKGKLFEANPEKEPGAPANVFAVRERLIAATFEGFAPHLVVVDQTPAGLAGELRPVLKRRGHKGARPMFVLGLRDIVFGAERTRRMWEADGAYELLEHAYDLILVYGSPVVFDPITEYQFPPAVAAKTRFTSYFRRPEPLRPVADVRGELGALEAPLVVVSAGGGKDGAALIEAFLNGVRRGYLSTVRASVVAGPQMRARDFARMADLAASLPGVTLVQFRRDLESHVAAADVVVTMGGYNSVWEAIGAGKRPIVVPRHGGADEQPLRAERLAALGLATVVPPRELSPARLADAINASLAGHPAPAPALPVGVEFDGIDTAGKALAEILRRRLEGAEPVGARRRGAKRSPDGKRTRKKGETSSRTDAKATANGLVASAGVPRAAAVSLADVVICVHDAVEDVRRCLASFMTHTDARHRLVLVDDGSGPECRAELERFAAIWPAATLLRNDERAGYTQAANRGLRESRAGLVVLLNSDTIVTAGWLERLLECAESDERIGIVGPLSNAATFQSVPDRPLGPREAAHNWLPPGWSPDDVAAAVATIAPRAFPRVGVLNGFCFAIKRAVIEAVGYFDEQSFPDGYGEEVDYCLRATKAGFDLAVADHAYVYHAANQSYGPERRAALKAASRKAHLHKHKAKRIRAAIAKSAEEPTLAMMRERLADLLGGNVPSSKHAESKPRVLRPMAAR
jgi:predicted glycosyltransferase/GT2 family glycosyltransferase